jgi:hypothetical protein
VGVGGVILPLSSFLSLKPLFFLYFCRTIRRLRGKTRKDGGYDKANKRECKGNIWIRDGGSNKGKAKEKKGVMGKVTGRGGDASAKRVKNHGVGKDDTSSQSTR